jgi:phage tail-like protein
MAHQRDRPYGHSNFLVDFGDGKAGSAACGFSEVIFPVFGIEPTKLADSAAQAASTFRALDVSPSQLLVLKRGFIGSLDLYAWWNKARQGRAPKRKALQVQLLSDNHETVVATWRFRDVRPVSLSYSPLLANEGGILIETVAFAFESMEMR